MKEQMNKSYFSLLTTLTLFLLPGQAVEDWDMKLRAPYSLQVIKTIHKKAHQTNLRQLTQDAGENAEA